MGPQYVGLLPNTRRLGILKIYHRERYDVECLIPTFRSGLHSVMVWGCFVGEIKGPLRILKNNIQKQKNFPRNLDELKNALKGEWSKFDVAILGGRWLNATKN
ncbi:hypothetical protein Glove_19g429 [Diversispora epigaea]|uniref:Uncharacterized protein n=1 Tax=Diversispora epigaea TaxID=1348612 RepID=A0A397JKV9_9GLOM|nr:hypothetical protein Glove_19g429 [Diversispora epigaea]